MFCCEHLLSQYLVEPKCVHLVAAKHVMRYIKGTLEYGLCFNGDHDSKLIGYTDLDWHGSVYDRNSTSRCFFSLRSTMTSWQSREQSNIAPSTTKEENIVACFASCEAIWLQLLLTDIFDLEMEAIVILCDNLLYKDDVFHDESKAIDIRYHFILDMVQRGSIKLQYVSIDKKVAN